jgi:hypothetical protein
MLAAQTLILDEVESQYGGAAEAAAVGSEKMKLAFGQIQDALGAALAPAFEKFTTYFINEVVPPLTKFFEEDFPIMLEEMQPFFDDLMLFFTDVNDELKTLLDIDADTSLLEGLLEKFNEIGDNPEFQTFLQNVKDLFEELGPLVSDLVFHLGELAVELAPIVKDALNEVIPILGDFSSILSDINFFVEEIVKQFTGLEEEVPGLIEVFLKLINPFAMVQRAAEGIARALRDIRDAFSRLQNDGFDLGNPAIDVPLRRGRANGGRVTGGMPYMVGEMGPELFMPGRGGNIVPNDQLRGGGTSIVINVTAGMGTNGAQVGEQIVNAIKRYERTSGPVFASA